jgi:hypothetical protein
MRKTISLILVLASIFWLAVSSHANLIDMGDQTIYDTDRQLTWLKDAGESGLRT